MAQNFRQYKMRAIGTSNTDVPDGSNFDSYDCLIGIHLTNITSNAITVSCFMTVSNTDNNPADENKFYLLKDVTIPSGSALQVLDGGAKMVVQNNDRLWFVSDTASSLDVIVSAVDAISS